MCGEAARKFFENWYFVHFWTDLAGITEVLRGFSGIAEKKKRKQEERPQPGGGVVRLTRGTPIAEPIVAPEFGAPHR